MPSFTIQISAADAARIAFRASSAEDWVQQAAAGCASLGQTEIEASDAWMKSIASYAQTGGDVSDKDEVLLHGVQTGLIKSAEERAAEVETANAEG